MRCTWHVHRDRTAPSEIEEKISDPCECISTQSTPSLAVGACLGYSIAVHASRNGSNGLLDELSSSIYHVRSAGDVVTIEQPKLQYAPAAIKPSKPQ